jgi:hypothetical protein
MLNCKPSQAAGIQHDVMTDIIKSSAEYGLTGKEHFSFLA